MRFTFFRHGAAVPDRQSRYLLGGIKLLVLLLVSAALTAAKCGGGCTGCIPCPETKKVTVVLNYQGAPVTGLKPGSYMNIGVYNAAGDITYLDNGLMTFNDQGIGTVNLTTPMPRSALIDDQGYVRNPPDATFGTWDDRLCSIETCGPPDKRWRYRIVYPPTVDYDFKNCALVFKFNTRRDCTFCP